jgi:hypothetical protein
LIATAILKAFGVPARAAASLTSNNRFKQSSCGERAAMAWDLAGGCGIIE